jgi:hypothetical protein
MGILKTALMFKVGKAAYEKFSQRRAGGSTRGGARPASGRRAGNRSGGGSRRR